MRSVNNKILVRVDLDQKNQFSINGTTVKSANDYETNYRHKSPVIATVVNGNSWVKEGDLICCHHNYFFPPSPYYLQDDLYSIPFSGAIFGVFDKAGVISPICGNMICKRIDIPTLLPVPTDQAKQYINRYTISDPGLEGFRVGDTIFTRPHAGYEIVYVWENEERRVIKVHIDMVCGVLK